jgi:hypothetical protein
LKHETINPDQPVSYLKAPAAVVIRELDEQREVL